MAEENKNLEYETQIGEGSAVETQDRGLFDFIGKKKEEEKKPQEQDGIATEFDEKAKISEDYGEKKEHKDQEEKKPGLLEKLHRQDTSSSSSSDEEEEVGEGGEKRKKKKKKDKKGMKEKILGDDDDDDHKEEKMEKTSHVSFIEETSNIADHEHDQGQPEEKKGFLEKIKEKISGYHPKTEQEKEKEKESH